jgi:hypothetical protein
VQELWSFECEDEIRGSPVVHRGILYVGCYDNNLYALDAKRGTFQKYPPRADPTRLRRTRTSSSSYRGSPLRGDGHEITRLDLPGGGRSVLAGTYEGTCSSAATTGTCM